MAELMRDTLVGDFIRIFSGHRILPYAEEKDPSLWKRYVHHEKTDRMAHHGHIQEETEEEQDERRHRRRSSETTAVGDEQPTNLVTGHVIDKEKGRDINVVHWYGEDDPEAGNSSSFTVYAYLNMLTESYEMVQSQKVFRHSRNLFVDHIRLHWQCHLYTGNRGNHSRLRRISSQGNPRSYVRLSSFPSNSSRSDHVYC